MPDYVDHDLLDESMLRTGALSHYKVLAVLHGSVMEKQDAELIAKWISRGGRVLVADVPKFESVEMAAEPETILFGGTPQGRSIGSGWIRRFDNWDELGKRLEQVLGEIGYPTIPVAEDGVYAAQIAPDRLMMMNLRADTRIGLRFKGKSRTIDLPALRIVDVTCP